jgi:uncharacterized protein (DUF1501 family)
MTTSRRELLRAGISGATVLSLGSTVPMFVSKLAFADAVAGSPISNDNILVVVQLSGGNDGLNTVIPSGNDVYRKARPTLGVKDGLIKLNSDLSLNPGLSAFKEMYDAGMLAIVNGCGYPEPSRSHFASMEVWHTADPRGSGDHGGWLGHYLDHCCRGTSTVMPAINIGSEIPQALANDSAPVPSIQSIDDFRVRTDPAAPNDSQRQQQIIAELNRVKDASPALQFLSRQATNAIVDADQLHKLTAGYHPDVDYPQGLGQQLKTIAQVISGNFGTKVYYCQVGGFDTHSNQSNQHETLLRQVSTSIQAFYRDLAAKKLDSKVTLMCFSEFGRRVTQNDSAGTDHGTAGPMFVCGSKVKGGLHGAYPSLTDLESGDIKFTTDFRRVYATLLSQWLNADASAVLKDHFEPIAFLGGTGASLSRGLLQKSSPNSAGNNGGGDDAQPMQSQQSMQMKAQS